MHVKVGETIQLKATATDKDHGIRIKPIAVGVAEGSGPGLEITSKEDCVKFKKHEGRSNLSRDPRRVRVCLLQTLRFRARQNEGRDCC